MKLPLQITIQDIPKSPALISNIQKKAEKLDRYYDNIMSCRIVVKVPQKHMNHGKVFCVHIDITVPSDEIAVTKHQNKDVYVAVRDAFNAARRQLQSFSRRQRGEVKNHETVTHGTIARIFADEGYGFIRGFDGQEYYFHQNNVVTPFTQLDIGSEVMFLEIIGESGLSATRISTGKHKTLANSQDEPSIQ